MILKRLREETREAHEALEQELPLGTAALTQENYRQVLAGFWGFYATWESEALAIEIPALRMIVADRRKLHLIEADLAWLHPRASSNHKEDTRGHQPIFSGTELEARLDPAWLPDLTREASLLGSMYVVEGSTLGGQVISRQLESHLGMSDGAGYSFFRSYGSGVGQQWKAFTALLEAASGEDADEIVRAAQQTFAAFRHWFSEGARTGEKAAWTE